MKYFLALLLLAGVARGQERFFTREMRLETGVLIGQAAFDGYTTQEMFKKGLHEEDPLARPLVTRGIGGQVAASSLGVLSVLGTSYLLRRGGHPKTARWVMRLTIGLEGANCVRQGFLVWERKNDR